MATFTYSPLDRRRKEIRLLRFQAVSDSTPRVFSLDVKTVSLDSEPTFVALSYTWGSTDNARTLVLRDLDAGQGVLEITCNLAVALPKIVDHADGGFIWIDAISINQNDADEKSWQVQLMAPIFRAASSVFIWLGPDYDDGSLTLQKLHKIGTEVCEEEQVFVWEAKYWFDKFYGIRYAGVPPEEGKNIEKLLGRYTLGDDERASFQLTPLRHLLHRAWWQRIWVFQEIVLAAMGGFADDRHRRLHRTIFACGSARSSLYYIAPALCLLRLKVIAELGKLHAVEPSMDELFYFDSRPFLMASARVWMNKVPLWTLLQATSGNAREDRRLHSSDPRDRVYALLALSEDAETIAIKPDYTKTCAELYTELTAALAKRSVATILHARMPQSVKALPSWVVDWSAASQGHFYPVGQDGVYNCGCDKLLARVHPVYVAAGQRHDDADHVTVDEQQGILKPKGFVIDTVAAVLPSVSWRSFLTTAASLLDNTKYVNPPSSDHNPEWRPSRTEEEFHRRQLTRRRVENQPIQFSFPHENLNPTMKKEINSTNRLALQRMREAIELDPYIEWKWFDTENFKALVEAVAALLEELRLLCKKSKLSQTEVEEGIWKALVADQCNDYTLGPVRPSKDVRDALTGFHRFAEALGLCLPVQYQLMTENALEELIHFRLKSSGFLEDGLTMQDVKRVMGPKSTTSIAVFMIEGELRMAITKNETSHLGISTYFKPLDHIAAILHESGALKGERFSVRENVARDLSDGLLDYKEITDATWEEVGKLVCIDANDLMTIASSGLQSYVTELRQRAVGRIPFATAGGRPGLGPQDMQSGDTIVALHGLSSLVVLRQTPGTTSYTLIGECYVHGAMDGELAAGRELVNFEIR